MPAFISRAPQSECTLHEYERSRKADGNDDLLTTDEAIRKDVVSAAHAHAR
jgi:hypothetical protein